MGAVKSCCHRQTNDKLMVTKMDLSHCGCLEVPPIVFTAERCIETLILASNQITSLPPQLFHCQEMKHLNLNDNCLTNIPPAIGSFPNLISLKLDKNNFQELPDNLKMCKKLKRLSLNNNPWKQMPNIVTQLISLEELYMNDCELNYLPASVGRFSKLKIMELRNNNLCNLPLSMTRLEMLTRLDISDNEFNEFPTCISKLKSLNELLLDNNDLEEIIDIENLTQLEHLDASYNHISNVSETIGCCTSLNMLNLSYNYIEQLPNSIGNISQLQTLHLEMNELTEIPKSIGKLSCLEELNLCNNKLYSLPNTIGLLRNLRNLNVSRNLIEEFPPEIGSCTKLAIINAAYNRLQVLPPEIGYLNNLKVLDLVGNFLMHLPITIVNLRGVRAIWLSANQNIPLIPFTEDLNLASGERFLTNIALPQLGEISLVSPKSSTAKVESSNDKTSSWIKKIRFAEDENILPGKLHRTPTPFPKELRAPNRKVKREESRANENYVNIIDGKVSDQEVQFSKSPPACILPRETNIAFSDGFLTRIKEANIKRNNKDAGHDKGSSLEDEIDGSVSNKENDAAYSKADYVHRTSSKKTNVPLDKSIRNNPLSLEEITSTKPELESNHLENEIFSQNQTNDSFERHPIEDLGDLQNIYPKSSYKKPISSSNSINGKDRGQYRIQEGIEKVMAEKVLKSDSSSVPRDMYHNDVLYGYRNTQYSTNMGVNQGWQHDGNVDSPKPRFPCSNNSTHRDHNFVRMSSINSNHNDCRKIYPISPPPPPPLPHHLLSPSSSFERQQNSELSWRPSTEVCKSEPFSSKQDYISLAEQMKNRNIQPPCYEIAKMYSTKAALFEKKQIDNVN